MTKTAADMTIAEAKAHDAARTPAHWQECNHTTQRCVACGAVAQIRAAGSDV